jgi:hypothetical protein
MTEELITLKRLLLKGDISGALEVVEELEEMSRDDKISNIANYGIILLLHLIKREAEQRTTRSWDVSIRNSVREIRRKNKRRKVGGYYLEPEELRETLEEAYPDAVDVATLEVEEGHYDVLESAKRVNKEAIIDQALGLIVEEI